MSASRRSILHLPAYAGRSGLLASGEAHSLPLRARMPTLRRAKQPGVVLRTFIKHGCLHTTFELRSLQSLEPTSLGAAFVHSPRAIHAPPSCLRLLPLLPRLVPTPQSRTCNGGCSCPPRPAYSNNAFIIAQNSVARGRHLNSESNPFLAGTHSVSRPAVRSSAHRYRRDVKWQRGRGPLSPCRGWWDDELYGIGSSGEDQPTNSWSCDCEPRGSTHRNQQERHIRI